MTAQEKGLRLAGVPVQEASAHSPRWACWSGPGCPAGAHDLGRVRPLGHRTARLAGPRTVTTKKVAIPVCSSKVTPEGRLAKRIGVARSSAFPLCSNVHAAASSFSPFILATWSTMLDNGCIGVTFTLCLLPACALDSHDQQQGMSGSSIGTCGVQSQRVH